MQNRLPDPAGLRIPPPCDYSPFPRKIPHEAVPVPQIPVYPAAVSRVSEISNAAKEHISTLFNEVSRFKAG